MRRGYLVAIKGLVLESEIVAEQGKITKGGFGQLELGMSGKFRVVVDQGAAFVVRKVRTARGLVEACDARDDDIGVSGASCALLLKIREK